MRRQFDFLWDSETPSLDAKIGEALRIQHKMCADQPKLPTNRPALLDAIEVTLRTIEERTGLYRILVVTVCAVAVLSIATAVIIRQWMSLAGLVLLVPLTGGFFFLDSRLVRRWRARIVEMERLRSLDLNAFRKTISGFRHLPPNALKAMLSTIPASRKENRQSEEKIAGIDFDAMDQKTEFKTLYSTGLITTAFACLIGAAFYGSLALLLTGGILIIFLVVFKRRS
jgi:hypothetical protein